MASVIPGFVQQIMPLTNPCYNIVALWTFERSLKLNCRQVYVFPALAFALLPRFCAHCTQEICDWTGQFSAGNRKKVGAATGAA
jgi:hypothetical protein